MGIALQEGPFKKLHGDWQFIALRDDACKVVLTLEFEFAGKLIDTAFGKVFSQVANSLVESFVERAREVYRG
jgi:ribosome-associated toxin RatA of RatAB toxin-antitoxin module